MSVHQFTTRHEAETGMDENTLNTKDIVNEGETTWNLHFKVIWFNVDNLAIRINSTKHQ